MNTRLERLLDETTEVFECPKCGLLAFYSIPGFEKRGGAEHPVGLTSPKCAACDTSTRRIYP